MVELEENNPDSWLNKELMKHQAPLFENPDGEEPELYPCPKCKKVYRWMISLRRHMRLECGQEPKHTCLYCGRRFKHKHHLIGHMAIHVRRGHQLDPLILINNPNINVSGSSAEKGN